VRENDAEDLSAIVSARSNSAGAHDVDENVFVDQRGPQVGRRDWPERSIDLVIGISRGTAGPDAPECYGGSLEQIAALHETHDDLLCKGNSGRHPPRFKARKVHAGLMLALAHADRCRPKGASLKSGNDLFRVAGSIDKNHRYSTRLERFHGARADSAAQYGLTIPQRIDKP
jgi:hypothetical protein